MTIMSRWQKQQLALQHTVQTLRTELIKTKTKLSEAQGSAELLAATKDFCKDGKACSGTFFFTSSQNNDNVLFFPQT